MAEASGSGRATATVLFTDLVGSTELRCRLGGQAAEELRRKHDRLLREAVEAHQGRVVKGLGDGIMAFFVSAADAVAASVAIQRAIDRHNRSGDRMAPLEVRVGLSAGDVTFDDGDCFGIPVVEACRLGAVAAGGQILTSEVVRLLAAPADGYRFLAAGALELKGLPGAVTACELVWEPEAQSPVPLPLLLTDVGRIFVGREQKLERLEQLWKEAAAGDLRVALLAGEPGVGKTRLAVELAAGVHEQGATVLAGRCDEELGVPYQPFVEALRHFVDHTPSQDLVVRLGRYGAELVRLLPELDDRLPGLGSPLRSDPETEQYRLFDAVAAWLAAVSTEAPLLLVVDDLQWAAKPTLLLLRHVIRSPEPGCVLVLGTYRDTELRHGHPLVELLADLRRQPGVERLSLSGLDQASVLTFMAQAAGHEMRSDGVALAGVIHLETEGNPFFVGEVIRHLAETGAIERRDGRWTTRRPVDQVGIPEGVREVVGHRLARLSDVANRALRVAAVVGTEFEPGVVQIAGGFDEEALLVAVEEAIAARLVLEIPGSVPRHRFAHALVRDTLYGELSAIRRATVHRRVAEAIEGTHADRLEDHLPALAYHYGAAAPAPAATAKAVAYATRAGDRALSQLAHDEAVTYYRRALELLDVVDTTSDEPRRVDLLIALGEAERRAGDAAHRQTLLDAARLARHRGDADALARAALANYRGFWSMTGTVDAERVAVLESALDAGEPGESPLRPRLLANLAAELHYAGQGRRRRALSDEALATALRLGDPATLAHVMLGRCAAIWEPSTSPERLANTAELLTVAARLGDPAVVAWTWVWRLVAATELGDIEEADRSLDQFARLATELGQPMLVWAASYCQVCRILLAGRLPEAERLAGKALEQGVGAGQPDAHSLFGLQRFHIRFEQGRLSELIDRVARALEHKSEGAHIRALLALAYCELDRDDEASRVFEPLAATLTERPVDVGWLYDMTASAAVSAQLGHRPLAGPLLDLLAPYADQLAGIGLLCAGSVSHYLGLLATTLDRFVEAEERFAAAAATHSRIGAPTWLARTRLEWARMLLTRRRPGDAERARELLGQARATARELDLANVERRAVKLLR